ncbi:MAG: ABC transporter substrate-binding protein [Kutzneria sp.]|nr:ABC transporter substrate-binding protein [Kutzneria sp.]
MVATACTGAPPPTVVGGADHTAMVLADPVEPASLNPLLGYAPYGAAKLFDGLLAYDANRTLQPALAKRYPEPSADGRSWTVHIRDDILFADGTKLDAADVAATYRALLDPTYGATVRSGYDMLADVVLLDATTVRFDLAYPYPPFPAKLVLGIVSRTALGVVATAAKPVGTGPYQLVSWTKGDRMVLQANKSYFGGVPKVTKLTVVFVPDDTARASRMRAGEFDGVELPPARAAEFVGTDGVRVITQDSAEFLAVTLPTHNPVTADRAMRLALNYAVDRAGLVGSVLAGKGTPAYTPMPDTLPEFVEPQARYRHDRDEATHILDQAGWTVGADGIRSRGGVPARFTLMCPTGDSERTKLAQAVAKQVREVGVAVDVTAVDRGTLAARAGTEAEVMSAGDPFDPDLGFASALHTGGTANPGGYTDTRVDAALDSAHRATDPAQRAAAFRQAQRAYLVDPGLVVLASVGHTYVTHDYWTGYQSVVEPFDHGALSWGPWWNLRAWVPR